MKDLSIGGIVMLDNTSGEAEEIVEPMEVIFNFWSSSFSSVSAFILLTNILFFYYVTAVINIKFNCIFVKNI